MPTHPDTANRVSRLRRLARLLDSSIRLPGGFRVGLDGFIGLLPVAGDAVGAMLSTYIVVQGARLGAPTTLLMRMMLNVLVELAVGAVPLLGDLFDFAWKANDRNVRLLERHLSQNPADDSTPRRLGRATLGLLVGFVLILVLVLLLVLKLLLALIGVIGGGAG